MTTDSSVQVPPDSTGKYIRTFEVLQVISGVAQLVEVQGVVLIDAEGNPVDFRSQATLLTEIRDLLQALVEKD